MLFLQTGARSPLQSKESKHNQSKLARARARARTHTHTHTVNSIAWGGKISNMIWKMWVCLMTQLCKSSIFKPFHPTLQEDRPNLIPNGPCVSIAARLKHHSIFQTAELHPPADEHSLLGRRPQKRDVKSSSSKVEHVDRPSRRRHSSVSAVSCGSHYVQDGRVWPHEVRTARTRPYSRNSSCISAFTHHCIWLQMYSASGFKRKLHAGIWLFS